MRRSLLIRIKHKPLIELNLRRSGWWILSVIRCGYTALHMWHFKSLLNFWSNFTSATDTMAEYIIANVPFDDACNGSSRLGDMLSSELASKHVDVFISPLRDTIRPGGSSCFMLCVDFFVNQNRSYIYAVYFLVSITTNDIGRFLVDQYKLQYNQLTLIFIRVLISVVANGSSTTCVGPMSKGSFAMVNIFSIVQRLLFLRPPSPLPKLVH